MALTLTGTGLQFPDSNILSGVIGTNYIARWANADQITSSNANDTNLNLEVVMPPVTNVNNKYLLMSEVHCNDNNSNSAGVGLSFWVEQSNGNGNTQWVTQQGYHCQYLSGGYDTYFTQQHWIIDDPGNTHNSPAARVGDQRKYRVYGDANNNNIRFCTTDVGARVGWAGYLLVVEIDAGCF